MSSCSSGMNINTLRKAFHHHIGELSGEFLEQLQEEYYVHCVAAPPVVLSSDEAFLQAVARHPPVANHSPLPRAHHFTDEADPPMDPPRPPPTPSTTSSCYTPDTERSSDTEYLTESEPGSPWAGSSVSFREVVFPRPPTKPKAVGLPRRQSGRRRSSSSSSPRRSTPRRPRHTVFTPREVEEDPPELGQKENSRSTDVKKTNNHANSNQSKGRRRNLLATANKSTRATEERKLSVFLRRQSVAASVFTNAAQLTLPRGRSGSSPRAAAEMVASGLAAGPGRGTVTIPAPPSTPATPFTADVSPRRPPRRRSSTLPTVMSGGSSPVNSPPPSTPSTRFRMSFPTPPLKGKEPPPPRTTVRQMELATEEERRRLARLLPLRPGVQIECQITNAQIDEYRKSFAMFDKNASGRIDAEELYQVFQALGREVSQEDIRDMIEVADKDRSGTVEFEEFVLLATRKVDGLQRIYDKPRPTVPAYTNYTMTSLAGVFTVNKAATRLLRSKREVNAQAVITKDVYFMLRRGFDELDSDGSGGLSLKEIQAAGEMVAGRRFDAEMFHKWDRDRSGYVSFIEMLREWYPAMKVRDLQRAIAVFDPTRSPVATTDAWCENFEEEGLDEICDIFDLYYRAELTLLSLRRIVQHSQLAPDELEEFFEGVAPLLDKKITKPKEIPVVQIIKYLYDPVS